MGVHNWNCTIATENLCIPQAGPVKAKVSVTSSLHFYNKRECMLDLTCEKFANFSLSFGCPKKPVYSVENGAP